MLTADLIRCPHCGANNRVSLDRLAHAEVAKCGRCKTPLTANGVTIAVTDASFALMVDAADVPVLVDLWAPWCGPCLMVAPTLDKLAAEWGGRVRIAKVNVDENPATANRFQARSIPLLVIMKAGREVDRIVGVQPANVIRQRVERHLSPAAV